MARPELVLAAVSDGLLFLHRVQTCPHRAPFLPEAKGARGPEALPCEDEKLEAIAAERGRDTHPPPKLRDVASRRHRLPGGAHRPSRPDREVVDRVLGENRTSGSWGHGGERVSRHTLDAVRLLLRPVGVPHSSREIGIVAGRVSGERRISELADCVCEGVVVEHGPSRSCGIHIGRREPQKVVILEPAVPEANAMI